ncbi:aldehyde dehydrogenase family protein [Methyloligella sp. 2.7D]|uniref:aldehyde dehydrogenase family protein n=1 Tax=unclassified Methyloligella TaxID=2625955 RepID=UPI00157BF38D|nr:aldehyde dehydrogenase family protein [Methyloligella sp. GL2]QKP76889.1 aldehyde dehydrogenase [Methyloligella sp. GL2]
MEVQERLKAVSGQIYMDGGFAKSGASEAYDVIDPATELVIGEIPETPAAEIDAAVESANQAQKGWWKLAALERAHILHHVADKMIELKPLLAEALTREMGKPYKESLDEVDWSAHTIRHSAEIARSDMGRVMGPATAGQFHYTLKLPLGTAALIMPFNYPMVLLAWEAGAALATGNAVVVKPSEYTTLTTLLFAEAFSPLPKGLFQIVSGGPEVGKRLVEHSGTHAVAFTGSIPVGQSVAESCGRLMKPSLIETSGNDPFLVMPSAPLELTARAAAFSAYMNCGQICVSAERYYVHEDIHDAFVDALVKETEKVRVGNGLDKVDMGPMVSQKERDRYEALLKNAIEEGARPASGGGRPSQFNRGWFVEPTVLVDCTPDMRVFHQESFGPIAPICRVKSFEEAVELANNSKYGLGANIYTTDLHEGIRAAEELEAGMVWVNAPLLDNDAGPFGGTKMSGMGRQLGPEGLETFRSTKTVMIDPDCEAQDFWWFPYSDEEMYPGEDA